MLKIKHLNVTLECGNFESHMTWKWVLLKSSDLLSTLHVLSTQTLQSVQSFTKYKPPDIPSRSRDSQTKIAISACASLDMCKPSCHVTPPDWSRVAPVEPLSRAI